MPVEEVIKTDEKRNVLVGIRIDNYSRDLLSWALVKVAEPGDCVVAIHVCRNSDQASKSKPLLDTYLEVYKGLCSARKVDLIGKIFSGSSVRRILVREAKNYAAIALVVGMSRRNKLGRWSSPARYCTKRLPPTTDVLAIHNGKIVFGKGKNNHLLPGVNGDPRPSLCSTENISPREINSEFGDSEADTEKSSFALCLNSEDETRDSDTDSKYRSISFGNDQRRMSLRSSFLAEDIMEHRPGWPLLARASLGTPEAKLARNLSVVQWVMHLPDRSPQQSPRFSTIEEKAPLERQMSCIVDESIRHSSLDELRDGLRILLETNSSSFKWFSYEVLKSATSQFSSENMIGKGGCNRVYKGILPDGKRVAVKIMQSSREAWKDFAREVDIISSVEHRHITPLLGVCIEDTDLISVYEFLSKGSLEEYLHGKLKDKQVLSWEVRFKVAVGIAEALNYLHNECSRPVIHRDVKTSNILLSDRFQPQAKPMIENGNVKNLLDPNLKGKINEVQMQRMVLATARCITRAARLRPKMREVLNLLKGDTDSAKWVNSPIKEENEDLDNQDVNDDEVYPHSSAELHLGLALLDVDDDSTSFSSLDRSNTLSFEDYLKGRWSRSSSFN
ncbi:hypothetical protein Patl1_36027 [Pistacia atlantica]|nr:hypothetical protein Patl1_36027 [Pistacia atlantica]